MSIIETLQRHPGAAVIGLLLVCIISLCAFILVHAREVVSTAQASARTAVRNSMCDGIVAMAQPSASLAYSCWSACEELRKEEGASVELLCENPDGDDAIIVTAEWTGWTPRHFTGHNIEAALLRAVDAKKRVAP